MTRIFKGLLGWSNKRAGVEFYRWDDRIIPRHDSEWGNLLAFEEGMRELEGSPVICIVLPRNTAPDEVRAIEERLREVMT